ncbi:MAG: phage shock protein operon transcriptional activator, partial [Janthinobacterium lividum]
MARSATTSPPETQTPIGEAECFTAMLAHVSALAPIARPVLVVGERGTGKELVAARLAFLSPRWDRPFLKLNCAALPDTLLDSELFGHEAGAFTGAQKRRAGRFEQADGGTLFLDEIGTASPAVQEKLLRVLEYGRFERVGGADTVAVDVRVVAATNADLPAMARDGRFRADLLDRLAFDVVTVPPLRARADDIPRLAEHFAARMSAELGRRSFAGFAPSATRRLLAHPWPGNVRELRNAVERSVALNPRPERPLADLRLDPFDSPFRPADARPPAREHPAQAADPSPERAGQGPAPSDFTGRVRRFETALLRDALEHARFNQAAAARLLGLG